MNINKAIIEATKKLNEKKNYSPRLDSEILMSEVIKKDRSYLILNPNLVLTQNKYNKFKDLIKKRFLGKPVAHLVGKKDFWKSEFVVNKDVLIPRPDSELLVEQTLKLTKNKSKLKILEIGIGSGCILFSILKERKDFRGVGIDISKKSVELSRINRSKLGLKKRVKIYKSDVDNFNYGKYDLIISNPPYINLLDLNSLDKGIKYFEPKLALNGGLEGLSEIRKVINKSSELIKKNGKLVLEIAFDQKEKVKKILKHKGFYINQTLKDLANNDRCIISTKI